MEEVIKRLESGESLRAIARSMGMTYSTLESRMARAGLSPIRIKLEAQRKRMMALRGQGKTNKEIAAAIGCSEPTVYNNIGAGIHAKKTRAKVKNSHFVTGWQVPSLCR